MIEQQLNEVLRRIETACSHCGRDTKDITLIAVSKTKPLSMLEKVYALGIRNFGENKVQEIMDKKPQMPQDSQFHMIGHLQRNKVRQVLKHVQWIHSVDSVALAEQIQAEAIKTGQLVNILLEVNVAKEASKYGFFPEDLMQAVGQIGKLSQLRIGGLMTIAPFVVNSEENRPIFKKLYQLSVDIKSKNIDNVSMSVLSMGMSGDYEVAIQEGATMIRVGTSIFGTR